MRCQFPVTAILFTAAFAASAALAVQTSSIQGNVIDADGRPLKDAEIRFEQKGRRVSPIVSRTDIGGHYTAVLPRGVYKMSLYGTRHGKSLHHRKGDWSEFADRFRPALVSRKTGKTLCLGWW